MDYMREYEKWLASPALTPEEHAELESIRGDEKEIRERFYGPLEFGTAGLRGTMKVGLHQMNVHVIRWATQGFANVICAEGEEAKRRGVALCMDCRNHSMEFARAAAEVCAANGIHVRLFESLRPTPELSFAVREYGCQAGVNVTASHNPAIYNGIKVFMEGGRDADEVFTSELEGYIRMAESRERPIVELPEALAQGLVEYIDPMNEYIDNIMEAVDMKAIREAGLHIALDPMYGVSQTALQTILLTARCGVEVIHERRDALFGGRLPAPSEKTLAGLINFVIEHHCDLGIATDGDADRLGVIDDTGEFLHPNKILVLLYYYLLKYKGWKGSAVRNIATTHLLDRIAASFGEQCYEVPVGFKYVSGKMLETGAIIGGESSGGLTVRGHIQGKDGIYAGSLLVEMVAKTGRSLSQLWQEIEQQYGRCEMAERDYRFSQAKKAEIYTQLLEDKLLPTFAHEVERVSYQDGCKVYFTDGSWVICRFSGTEPLLRMAAEAETDEKAQSYIQTWKAFLSL